MSGGMSYIPDLNIKILHVAGDTTAADITPPMSISSLSSDVHTDMRGCQQNAT